MDLSINRGASLQTFKAITVPYNEKDQNNIAAAKKSVEDIKFGSSDGNLKWFDGQDFCTIFFDRKEKERDFMLALHRKNIDFSYFAEPKKHYDTVLLGYYSPEDE